MSDRPHNEDKATIASFIDEWPSHPQSDVPTSELGSLTNVSFHYATTQTGSLDPENCDFGHSLGVLHNIPASQIASDDCVRLLKPGEPFLVYLYYRYATLRTDSRDRFGIPLDQRFTLAETETMAQRAGLGTIRFSETALYWCAVGQKLCPT